MPGKNGEHAGAFVKAVAADSANAEAAYLYTQWATSPAVSLARVMLPVCAARSLPAVAFQVAALPGAVAGRQGLPGRAQQCRQLGGDRHDHVGRIGLLALPSTACAPRCGPARTRRRRSMTCAAEWDSTTEKLGVDAQRESTPNFKKQPGAFADNTIEKLGTGGDAGVSSARHLVMAGLDRPSSDRLDGTSPGLGGRVAGSSPAMTCGYVSGAVKDGAGRPDRRGWLGRG